MAEIYIGGRLVSNCSSPVQCSSAGMCLCELGLNSSIEVTSSSVEEVLSQSPPSWEAIQQLAESLNELQGTLQTGCSNTVQLQEKGKKIFKQGKKMLLDT